MIRQQIYSLLGCDEVVEIFWHKLTITGVKVSSTQLTSSCNNVTLASVESMTNREKQTLFYSVCNCDEQTLNHLTGKYSDWKFVTTTVRLWISNTEPTRKLVKALLLCFILCSGMNEGRLNALHYYDHMPVRFRKSQRWLDALHSFMQWQVIYHTAWTLNAFLNEPMTVFSPAYLYDGEIIMYLASAENIDHLFTCLVPYQNRTLHRYLEKSVLDLQSQTTQQTIVVPTTECISMSSSSDNLVNIVEQYKTDIDCLHPHSHVVHHQSNAASNECTLPHDSLPITKHGLNTRESVQKHSRCKTHENKGSLSLQSNETHCSIKSSGLESKTIQMDSLTNIELSLKVVELEKQSRAGQTLPPRDQSEVSQTHLPRQQSKESKTHLHGCGHQSKPAQTDPTGQQSKASPTHPSRYESGIGQALPPGEQLKANQTHPQVKQSKASQPGKQSKENQQHIPEQHSKAFK